MYGFCNVWVYVCLGFVMFWCVYVCVFNVWLFIGMGFLICGFCNPWVCVCAGLVICGCL